MIQYFSPKIIKKVSIRKIINIFFINFFISLKDLSNKFLYLTTNFKKILEKKNSKKILYNLGTNFSIICLFVFLQESMFGIHLFPVFIND